MASGLPRPGGLPHISWSVLIKCSPIGAGGRGLKRRSGVWWGRHNSSDNKTRKEDEKSLKCLATGWEMPDVSLL